MIAQEHARARRSSLGHMPSGAWEFDPEVVAVFDDMVSRSVPMYEQFHEFAVALAAPVVSDGSLVVDLGCSTGNLIARLRGKLVDEVAVYGVDESQPMVDEARSRFAEDPLVSVHRADVTSRDGFAWWPQDSRRADAAFAILTLMFLRPTARFDVIEQLRLRTNPGGLLVVVEKTRAEDADNERVLTRLYHAFKERSGYSRAEIDAKALSLQDVLRPWTMQQTIDVILEAGYRSCECFAKWGPFAGLVARR